jgi:hypothetical protein
MKYSQIKTLKNFCESLFSTPDYREVIANAGADDFYVDGVQFIRSDAIDQIQCDELESDEYMLGCFNAWFIADVLDIDQDVIEAMQKVEAFEAIGKLIISMDKLGALQQAYVSADGYGHHFNCYDGEEETISIDGNEYYVFDNH